MTDRPNAWVRYLEGRFVEGDIYDVRFCDGTVRRRCVCLVDETFNGETGDDDGWAWFRPANRHDRAPHGLAPYDEGRDQRWRDAALDGDIVAARRRTHQPRDIDA